MSSLSLESANYSSISFLDKLVGVSSSPFSEISDSVVSLSSESTFISSLFTHVYFNPTATSSIGLLKTAAILVENYTSSGDCRQMIVFTFSRPITYSKSSSEQKIVSRWHSSMIYFTALFCTATTVKSYRMHAHSNKQYSKQFLEYIPTRLRLSELL